MSRSKHRRPQPVITDCPHDRDPEACADCARRYLYDVRPRLEQAVTASRSSSQRQDFITGGTATWEPIDIGALSLLQDIGRQKLSAVPDGQVLAWRDRARVILHDAFAPYPAMREDDKPDEQGVRRTRPVPCPSSHCPGTLLLERDPDPSSAAFARVQLVRCTTNRRHVWAYGNGGFLRLRAALDSTPVAQAG